MNICPQCQTNFEITKKDQVFYDRLKVPSPTLCPACRQQRRLSHSNHINLFKRTCDKTKKIIVSCFPEKTSFPVWNQEDWYSKTWDPITLGRDYDFNRPFFDQFADLMKIVPRPALFRAFQFDENSDYSNYCGNDKNCYMLFDSDYCHDCTYSYGINKSKNCMDCFRVKESELCFECVDCVNCYQLYYSQDSENCSSSAFLKNCIGVKNSFFCSNLKNKEYHIFNQPFSKEKYEELMKSLSKYSAVQKYLADWNAFKIKHPQRFMHGVMNENVVGDYLLRCKNAELCFDSMELWDCKYFTRSFGSSKDCMDCDEAGDGIELIYEGNVVGYGSMNCQFCFWAIPNCHDLQYCMHCGSSNNLFGCFALDRKQYCILNKQYSKEDYETLRTKIIEHMKKTKEYGEFFPSRLSDYAYNLTDAMDFYPMGKEEAIKKGYSWHETPKTEYMPATSALPDDSKEASKEITKEILSCENCKKNYKIVEQELHFYKSWHLPLPKKCFYCRHKARIEERNKRKLYDRTCDQCRAPIKTTYSSDMPYKVFCESCYQKSLV